MLKTYVNQKGITLYQLAKISEVPYSTINDLANNKVVAENCKAGVIRKLARALQISMEELLDICGETSSIITENGEMDVQIYAKNKVYFVEISYNGAPYTLRVCNSNKISARYIKELAQWKINDFLTERKMEEVMDVLRHYEEK